MALADKLLGDGVLVVGEAAGALIEAPPVPTVVAAAVGGIGGSPNS
jgi:hypothetical protein